MNIKIPLVDLRTQYSEIKYEIKQAITEVCDNAAFIGGKYVKKFEKEFARFTGSTYTVGVGNGTDALFLSLRSLDLEPGFEAIIPANTFIATAEAVTNAAGQPVFCDVDPVTYLINLDHAETLVTSRTRVIIPVHLYGQMVDMKKVRSFANRHNLIIIEDAAQAHGVRYKGVSVGELSKIACYSFYPAKNLGAYGDGGAITTNDEKLAKKIRMLSNHGRIDKYDHKFIGFNSRLDGLQAAILSVKLSHLNQWNEQRIEAAEYYHKCLNHLGISLPKCDSKGRHVYHLYVIRVKNRNIILKKLKEKGIFVGIHYPIALPFLRAYSHLRYEPQDFPVTYSQMEELISLPIFPEIKKEQIEYVVFHLEESIKYNNSFNGG